MVELSPGSRAAVAAPFHVHLVSDATGETLKSLAKAALVQFEHADQCHEHLWALVRTVPQMKRVLQAVEHNRGIVLFTLVDPALRTVLQEGCRRLKVPYVSVLDPVIVAFANYFGEQALQRPGRQHQLDAQYFARIEAMDYTMTHDDGQHAHDLNDADVILVGVSRTSKTPTSIYLANRGLKTANVPVVPGVPLPPELEIAKKPLIVGLIAAPERLVQVRRNRLLVLKERTETTYVDFTMVRDEVAAARRLFTRFNWPVIDVTRRSIEETAAAVLNLWQQRTGESA